MTAGAPWVSVIIPTHDHAIELMRALASVATQGDGAVEVVVVDDGSTDDTVARAAGVGDPRIAVVSFPGAGLSTARNRGLARAGGAYLSFIDADDLWTPDKLELKKYDPVVRKHVVYKEKKLR